MKIERGNIVRIRRNCTIGRGKYAGKEGIVQVVGYGPYEGMAILVDPANAQINYHVPVKDCVKEGN